MVGGSIGCSWWGEGVPGAMTQPPASVRTSNGEEEQEEEVEAAATEGVWLPTPPPLMVVEEMVLVVDTPREGVLPPCTHKQTNKNTQNTTKTALFLSFCKQIKKHVYVTTMLK